MLLLGFQKLALTWIGHTCIGLLIETLGTASHYRRRCDASLLQWLIAASMRHCGNVYESVLYTRIFTRNMNFEFRSGSMASWWIEFCGSLDHDLTSASNTYCWIFLTARAKVFGPQVHSEAFVNYLRNRRLCSDCVIIYSGFRIIDLSS